MKDGFFSPAYIRASAGPGVAGRVNSSGGIVASTGRQTFTVAGAFSTGTRILMPSHPNGFDYTVTATPRAQGAGRFVSYTLNFADEAAVCFRNTSGNNVAR